MLKKRFRRTVAATLAFIMLMSSTAFANESSYIYLPETEIEDEIRNQNLFWLGSAQIEMEENSGAHYMVKVARGGDLNQETSVTAKFSDVTAKYGTDYKAYLYDGGLFNGADKKKDTLSVIEMMEGEEFNEFEIQDNARLAEDIENGVVSGGAIMADIATGMNQAVAENKAEKGEDNSDYIKAMANGAEIIAFENTEENASEAKEATVTEAAEGETGINSLAGAKQAFTGIQSDRVKPKASMDIIDQFSQLKAYQDVADTISDSMVNATLEIKFEAGESEKYIEIVPINNNISDNTRIFNLTIGDPTGDYTVSAYSTAVAQIVDDEPAERAKVYFAAESITADAGCSTAAVTIKREGDINNITSVMLRSKSNTAMSGRDFSPVSAEVVFPFGITERTVEIPVNTGYITERSSFYLTIDTPVSCNIGEVSQTEVFIDPFKAEDNENAELNANSLDSEDNSDLEAFMNDDDLKKNVRVYFPRINPGNEASRRIEKSAGFKDNCYQEGDWGWYIRPTDHYSARVEFAVEGKGFYDRYDIAGMTFSYYAKYAAHPHDGTAKAGFRVVRNGSDDDDFTFEGGSSGWSQKTIYTKEPVVRGVQVYAEDDLGKGRDIQAHFKDIYPIKRQFKITLAPADKMKLRKVSGSSVVLTDVQPTAYINNKMTTKSLGIDAADTDTLAYRTSGENLSITVGNNEYFKFVGLYAVNKNNGEKIKIADANGANTCTFELNHDLLEKLIRRDKTDKFDYVYFTDRKDGGVYGNITIKPVFEYINKEVYVEKNTQFENKVSINAYNEFGSLFVNGREYTVPENTDRVAIYANDSLGKEFHIGDEFIVRTKAKHADMASAAGIGYRTGTNIDTMNKTRTDKRNAEAEYAFTLKDKPVLTANTVAFYPIYTEKKNGLTLMVRKSDYDNNLIDKNYGIMSGFNVNNAVVDYYTEGEGANKKNVAYYRAVALSSDNNNFKSGQYTTIMARACDGRAIKWINDIDKKVYSGNTLYYEVKGLDKSDNVLLLSAESDNVINARFKGSVDCGIYDVSSGLSNQFYMPLSNAAVTIGGNGGTTDEKGSFDINNSSSYILNTSVMKRISVDNSYTYAEVKISNSNPKAYSVVNETFAKTSCKYNSGGFVEQTKNVKEPVYIFNLGNSRVEPTNEGAGIADVNVYEEDSTRPLSYVIDINDKNHTFSADVRETDDEHIKALSFVICDSKTKQTKYVIPADYNSSTGQWVATEKMNIAMTGSYTSGDTLLVKYSTDKNVSGAGGSLKECIPVYSGYDFVQGDSAYDTYEPQNFNMPTAADFVSLPMLDKLATGFDFPFVSIALEKRPTGEYRVKIGANISDIIDIAAGTHINPGRLGNDDAGMSYTGGIDWLHHPFQDIGSRAKFAYDSIFKKGLKETPLLNGATSKLGPSQFKVSIVVGGYIDFGKLETTVNGVKYSDFIVSGGGGYVGVTLTFKKSFYFLICGTVPAYVGGSASGTLIGNMGATRKSNAIVALSDMKNKKLEIDDALAFNGNLNANLSVVLYAGVGLCDVLGVRLQGQVDLASVWEPLAKQTYAMNDELDEIIDNDYSEAKIHELGLTVQFSLGGKVDLLLFSIPLMYKFDPIHEGFNKDVQNAHVRKQSNSKIDVNGAVMGNDTTAHLEDGWYYIRNVRGGKYLQAKSKNLSMVNVGMIKSVYTRFYVETKNNVSTIKAYEGYTQDRAKYLMLDKSNGTYTPKVTELRDDKSLNAYHKFYLREPNLGDFNIISASEGGIMYFRLDGNDNVTAQKTGSDNSQLWRFEPVDQPLQNALYTIKLADGRYLAEETYGGYPRLVKNANSNNAKWYILASSKDGCIKIKNAATNKYLLCPKSNMIYDYLDLRLVYDGDIDEISFETWLRDDGSYNIISATSNPFKRKYVSASEESGSVFAEYASSRLLQNWTITKIESDTLEPYSLDVEPAIGANGESLYSTADHDQANDINYTVYEDNIDVSDNNVHLRKRTTGDSQWVANDNIEAYSGFEVIKDTTLVSNSYEAPEPQLVELGGGSYMLIFIDTDSSRGDLERNAMKYSIYRNGQWSQPVTVQNDGTADFQISAADAGENVALAWISSDPDREKTGNATQYLTTMEVYTTLINKQTGKVGEITRLTNDSYYDYSPTVVYDEATGDMAVYYIKSSAGSSFLETGNSFTNDCIITYMLYDKALGKWLFDYYYPEEVSDSSTAEELIKNWGGQRFLPSPIAELGMEDPLITDFTAIGYNGLAVYGYSIDKDNSSDTNTDRDMFIQVYDFTTHKNHYPIRITDDNTADTMPQFVRAGGTDGQGHTYLYWFKNDSRLAYIDVSDLAHNGLNDDGTISQDYDLAEVDVDVKLPPSMKQGSNEAYATMSYYKVCVDSNDNIYIIWVDLDRETQKQEIFATAVISDEETGEASFADAYQLTHSGKHNDNPTFLVDDDGNMLIVSTRFNSEQTDDVTNPLEITDLELVATQLAPFGELYAESITLSDTTPKAGESVESRFKLYNRGLTAADGYKVDIYTVKDGQKLAKLDTISSEDMINAGSFVELSYIWAVTQADITNEVSLGFEVTEGGMSNTAMTESESLKFSPDITVDGVSIEQKGNDFYLHAVLTNYGNTATTPQDNLQLAYYEEKAPANMLGIENEQFVKLAVEGIEPEQSKEVEVKIDNLKGEMFNAYGYLPVLALATDGSEQPISNSVVDYIIMDAPIEVSVNGSSQLVLNTGEAVDLTMSFAPAERFNDVTPEYYIEDNSVAVIIDGQIVAIGAGTTKLIAVAQPYGSLTEIEIVVNDATTPEKPDEEGKDNSSQSGGGGRSSDKAAVKAADQESTDTTDTDTQESITDNKDYFIDIAEHWGREEINKAAQRKIVNGYLDNTFKPNNSVTRAEFVTILYNSGLADTSTSSDALGFNDVTGNEWYVRYISWGAEKGLIEGYDDGTFRGNNIISRQEMAVIISKFVKLAELKLNENQPIEFADSERISPWAKGYVDSISSMGIVKGDNKNCYNPQSSLTRAEAAVILNNLCE